MNKRVCVSKKRFRPKEEIEIIKEEVVEQKKIELPLREDPEPHISIEIPITPVSPTEFCIYKKITGTYKSFLEKKYATKFYTVEKWLEILIKENINH